MALPILIRVHGLGKNPDQTVGKGSIRFRAVALVSNGEADLMLPGDVSATFDSLGELEVFVPSSNDPDWAPVGWTWLISLSVDGQARMDWHAVVPYNAPGAEIGIGDLTPIPAADGQLYALYSHTHSQYATHQELDDAIASVEVGGVDLSAYATIIAMNNALALKAPLASPAFTGTPTGITKSHVGLPNVDNTSDANKPVSTAAQTALDLKAPLASPAFTGTPTGITKSHVGLGNVDNTADSAKPVSTAQQTALDLKAPLASPTFTGTVSGVTKAHVGLGNVDNTADSAKPVSTAQQTALNLKANLASPTFTGTVGGVTAAMVGLGSVNNTADSAKPVSTAQQTALDLKAPLASPAFTGTPTGITATHVGLANVNNTSDANKPVSTATQTALDAKQPIIKKWNGSAYVVATGAEIYVGAGTPSSPADGSIWMTS